ncbi:peptidoglycan-binding domain-containing protein [Asanoa sp. NPDC049573]|uniref:peptidoglycan-binding domain-containing protein n=1 Tax=Asanoa sp. NPDC049573 TaxID=3155396 RepID=UPI00342D8541
MTRTKRAARIGLWLAAMAATTVTSVVVLQSPSQAATLHCNRVGQSNDAYVPIIYPSWTPFDCLLTRGDNSVAVRQLQNDMNICYHQQMWDLLGKDVGVDGDFGPETERALRRVQQLSGTAADGEYGPNTRRAMLHQRTSGAYCGRVD